MPVYIVHLSATRGARRGARGARPRHDGLRRDVPAVPVPVARRPGQRLRGRQVRLLAAAAAQGDTGTTSGAASSRTTSSWSRPTTARSTSTARRSSGVGDFRKIPNGLPGVEDRVDLLHDGGVVGGPDQPRALGRDHLDGTGQDLRDVPAQGRRGRRFRRRPRRLRPEPPAHDLRRDAPHGRGLLVLRGPLRPGRQRRRAEPRHRSSSATASSPGARGPASSSSAPPPTTRAQTRGETRPRRLGHACREAHHHDRSTTGPGVRLLRGPGQRPALASARQGDLGVRTGRRRVEDPPGRRGARRPGHRRRHRGDRLRAALALRVPRDRPARRDRSASSGSPRRGPGARSPSRSRPSLAASRTC